MPAEAGGGLAAWSIRHPVGVSMIALALVVLGLFAYQRLAVDLLPHIIYPEIRVRVLDPGVPARIMEDRVTRQLEEQLAITEGAIAVQSRSAEGSSSVDLSFPYGTDIDVALRDASIRLDRAKRFLPDSIQPPIIYKRDPSQIAVVEFVVSSPVRDGVALRNWVDYVFSKWFLNLPGVAAAEVGGGLLREIRILPDLQRLNAVGLSLDDLAEQLRRANLDLPGGRLQTPAREYASRTAGRFSRLEEIAALPLALPGGGSLPLGEVAEVRDTHQDERIRVRFNQRPGVKLSIQKQPTANTVAVVDAVRQRLAWMRDNRLLPADIQVDAVSDQAVYIRHALNNAALAALSGALLAMAVVFLFLGDLRRTLIIGSAIPIALCVTFLAMALGGLTLNVMTLGGLAVGIGMLVDSTIVMLENIQRHQRAGQTGTSAGLAAAAEVNSPIVASTSTNLAAILPFLLISGLIGLLFRELIFTVASAVFASMVVALTLVPAWGARLQEHSRPTRLRRGFDRLMARLEAGYGWLLAGLLRRPARQLLLVGLFIALLGWSLPPFLAGKQLFLPSFDDGQIYVGVSADPGITLEQMDAGVRRLEALFLAQPEVSQVFVTTGGFIFGRTTRELSSRASLYVQLRPLAERGIDANRWIERMNDEISRLKLVGYRVYLRLRGLRGLRLGRGEDDINLRVQGPDLAVLAELGQVLSGLLGEVEGLRNIVSSSETQRQELVVRIDRERAAELGLSLAEIGTALNYALEGRVVSDFLDRDRQFDIRLRLPQPELESLDQLGNLLLFASDAGRPAVHLGDLARIEIAAAPAEILRDQQQRIVEVSASLTGARPLSEISREVRERLQQLELPDGYRVYDTGVLDELRQGRRLSQQLLGLALFLVLVVMAVQYESLRNPLVILLGVPFAATGAALALPWLEVPLSMPVWLGFIMLAGIVVNNAIVLVEYIELLRQRGEAAGAAIVAAGRQRLRPILMTTLTTVMGLTPLAVGAGAGAEMLQPLAQTLVFGLGFSLLVSLLLIPVLYRWLHPSGN
ncbi:efflux RND transporter permease subunit [Thiohalobacter sp. IOR34]|uniref:efflux RND transporter permease subunit n=1 Tax=Thiohalobacter sp. IOR34 TaxID=3057176 RepID=UPI0025B00971|nr:efflux RND transporter permease subunit [Thiohalobacter sp. IOR34]WJW75652.1 efflux RND transporter permease subunit [Thiohalobacter sp. IOR34]